MIGLCVIIYTYYISKISDEIITLENQNKISDQLSQQNNVDNDVFYNIKYSGIDLAGNRYILTSQEAINNINNPELVNMKFVEVNFYFKDETTLNVFSDEGIYNNKTLDMIFEKNVKAYYEGSELLADKANYSNLNGFLTISDNVIVNDQRGTLAADKLLFDIKKQNLNIISFNNNKINAKVDLKWKKVLEF
mgnify:CR=1 FL=1